MNHQVTASSDFRIRPLQTSTEIEGFFRLNAQVFRPDEDTDLVTGQRRRFIMEDPDFSPSQLRGAFLGKTYLGGYALLERWLCLGPARLHTGCISGVVTHPDYRHQGIATALMQRHTRSILPTSVTLRPCWHFISTTSVTISAALRLLVHSNGKSTYFATGSR